MLFTGTHCFKLFTGCLFFPAMSLAKQISGGEFIKELLLLASGADGPVWLVMLGVKKKKKSLRGLDFA